MNRQAEQAYRIKAVIPPKWFEPARTVTYLIRGGSFGDAIREAQQKYKGATISIRPVTVE